MWANNDQVLRVGLYNPYRSLPTQVILWYDWIGKRLCKSLKVFLKMPLKKQGLLVSKSSGEGWCSTSSADSFPEPCFFQQSGVKTGSFLLISATWLLFGLSHCWRQSSSLYVCVVPSLAGTEVMIKFHFMIQQLTFKVKTLCLHQGK